MQALQDKGWLFGGESSGHILCLDRHSTGDGVIAALQVMAAMRRSGKGLPALTSELHLLPQKLVNVKLQPDLEWESHPGLAAAYREVSATLQGRGRVLIRPSGTEPKLRLMVEADEEMLAVRCVDRLATSLA